MPEGKTKAIVLEIVKWLLVVAMAAAIILQLSGNAESDVPFDTVKEKVLAAADLSEMGEADNQMIKRLYKLSQADYDGICLYSPTSLMGVDEILLVRLSNTDQQDTVAAAIESRLDTQLSNFDGYGTNQYETLENSITLIRGNYILFVVAEDPDTVSQAFLDAI